MTWPLRILFAALIVLTLGLRLATSPPVRKGDEMAVAIAKTMAGRLTGPVTGEPWSTTFTVYSAPVSGCADPLIIVASPANFAATDVLLRMQRPGDHHLYAYRDWVAEQPERWPLLRSQISVTAQAMIGRRGGVNGDKMLFVAEPAGCAVAKSVAWSRFWRP